MPAQYPWYINQNGVIAPIGKLSTREIAKTEKSGNNEGLWGKIEQKEGVFALGLGWLGPRAGRFTSTEIEHVRGLPSAAHSGFFG